MANESIRIAQWIFETVNGSSAVTSVVGAGNIHELPAPQGTSYPFVGFSQLSSVDVVEQAHFRIMVNELWNIRVIDESRSYTDEMITVADALDSLFHRADGTADGATIFSSTREEPFRLPEDKDGKEYRHLGGVYRIYAQRN